MSDPAPTITGDLLVGLHRGLSDYLGEPIDLIPTNNRKRLLSWRRLQNGLLQVRVQRQFALGDDEIKAALAATIESGDPIAGDRLREFSQGFIHPPRRARRRRPGNTLGRAHDLQKHLDSQNEHYFGGSFGGTIEWSRNNRGRVRRTIRLGSWNASRGSIRVHPALDSSMVPDFVVSFVVFHELLHAELGHCQKGTKRCFHTPQFRERERAHPDYARSTAWIEEHLETLLSF